MVKAVRDNVIQILVIKYYNYKYFTKLIYEKVYIHFRILHKIIKYVLL